MMTPKTVFARDSTGLVREFSAWDVFAMCTALILPCMWSFSSQVAFLTSATPGADWVLSEHLGALFVIPLMIAYIMLSTAMPRSGGDYVWISRGVNPVLGFAASWGFWVAYLALAGINAYVQATVILPVALVAFGYSLSNPSLITSQNVSD